MSMWKKTLVYLGLVEEPEEYDEMPERFEEQARAARPAMHDTTGPIAVVRPDHEDDFGLGAVAGRASASANASANAGGGGGGGFRTAASSGDLTEPVGRVPSGGAARGAAEDGRRGSRPDGGGRGAGSRDGGGRATRGAESRSGGGGESSNVRALRPDDGEGGGGLPDGLGRRVAIVAVTDYEDSAREVGTRYRQGSPVVFDLTDAPTDSRKRVLDFVAGTIFALNGEMLKVGARSFMVVPKGTDIPEREWTRLATLGYRP